MRTRVIVFALVVFAFALPIEPAHACDARGRVGYKLLPLPTGRAAAVWYPTASPESLVPYGPGVASHLAVNSQPAACEPLPLLVFSHLRALFDQHLRGIDDGILGNPAGFGLAHYELAR